MPDSPNKKPSTLSLKPKASDDTETATTQKVNTNKTGARAHQHTRRQTEQRRAQKPELAEPDQPRRQRPAESGRPGASRPGTSRPGTSRNDDSRNKYSRNNPPRPRAMESEHRVPQRPTSDVSGDTVQPLSDQEKIFDVFASCPRGLEDVLASELRQLRFSAVRLGQAGCRFKGNWPDIRRANLQSRLATRILVELAHAKITNEDDLRALALDTAWEQWLGPERTLRVDTSAIRSPMQSLQYCNLLVKDSICDRLRAKEGARPSIDTVRPDVRVHSFLSQDSATLYLDTSGESLFKRGWRFDKTEAPIRENLAAGLLAIAGWQPQQALLDPFCGSGTILIEAAWTALNIAPGINRPFAFERLRGHDAPAWQTERAQATQEIRAELLAPIVGCDLSPTAIAAAKSNLQRAGLSADLIDWQVADAREFAAPADSGVIITNPPYGERLELDSTLMREWAAQLKRSYAGWQVNIISADLDLPGAMRLKAKRRVPLFNGALDCRVFMFDMVKAQYMRETSTNGVDSVDGADGS